MMKYALAICGLLCSAAGCERLIGPGLQRCADDVQVLVDVTAGPEIGWTPECGVSSVMVVDMTVSPPGGEVVWRLSSREPGDVIGTPIVYGRVPARVWETSAARKLVAGHQYLATLGVDAKGGLRGVGAVSFVAP